MYLYHVICCSEVLINYQREIIIVSAYRENSWEIYRRKYFTMFTDWTLPHWVPIGILRLISVWPVPNSKHAWGLPVAYTRPLNSYNENIFSKCHWNKIFWSPSLKKTFQTQTKMDGFWINAQCLYSGIILLASKIPGQYQCYKAFATISNNPILGPDQI